MDQITGRFPWKGERSTNQECCVSVREKRGGHAVYVDVYENGTFKRNSAIFLPEQLPALIEALQAAQRALER